MKYKYYRQCRLLQKKSEKSNYTTSWVPEQHAKVNNVCELFINGFWSNAWKIISVGSERVVNTEVEKRNRANQDFTHSIH